MIAGENASVDSLGFAAIEQALRDIEAAAAAVAQIRRRTDEAVEQIDPQLRDDVIQTREREIRKQAETQAATHLRDKRTHDRLGELAAEERFWSDPALILSRSRFTIARGDADDVSREATAGLAATLTLGRADADELRLTCHDALRRQWWAVAGAALREARHRARTAGAGELANPSPEHALAEELTAMVAQAFPMPERARVLFGRARAAAIAISEELRLCAQLTPR